jgi:hypothetical protein
MKESALLPKKRARKIVIIYLCSELQNLNVILLLKIIYIYIYIYIYKYIYIFVDGLQYGG